jgi:hypothetical protein
MPITMPTTVVEGIQLTVIPFRPDAAIGTMGLPTLRQLVPSPKAEEDKRALKYASGTLRRNAEVRRLVQRMLEGLAAPVVPWDTLCGPLAWRAESDATPTGGRDAVRLASTASGPGATCSTGRGRQRPQEQTRR